MKKVLAGIDIGGTKLAVSLAFCTGELTILEKISTDTPSSPKEAVTFFIQSIFQLMKKYHVKEVDSIGISCGGPLDSKNGIILSPPNLPNWDRIDLFTPLQEAFGSPVALQNDANACALAEWQWGAGRGVGNMIFLTFGTGMGAGLILNNQLYSGTNDMAGEAGHIRLEEDGPEGYGKRGSFEGFCSGGGIARFAQEVVLGELEKGRIPAFCKDKDHIPLITAKTVALAAHEGDSTAQWIYEQVGRKLGRGIALLVDILNPERIVIGSIYSRQQQLLEPMVMEELKKESLPQALKVCEIVPAELGEQIGDYASLSVALQHLKVQPDMKAYTKTFVNRKGKMGYEVD
ncbi:ROK family protein [Fictibacillus fluitans]|uniref:ROK family protein n=1 Tax=Fictibacillus fluitans TaxID=3058422 RepID=A0ABT8HTK2_9BACL|nr:ROK family protein [Fictibacillus sp. NE201]MDN4524078.1 ROK family protein [Fictibacillus sp. NE201]